MHPPPAKLDIDFLTDVLHFDRPKLLRFEILDAEISVDDEAESRELTRAYGVVSGFGRVQAGTSIPTIADDPVRKRRSKMLELQRL
jgi:hypothetical protein